MTAPHFSHRFGTLSQNPRPRVRRKGAVMSTTDLEILPPPTPERQAKAKKATGGAVFGTFIEYYDFSVYGYVAATLATVFFPSDNPTIGLLNTLLVFGSAFLVRPLGAMFFGWLGDRKGRRVSLIARIILMGTAAGLRPVARLRRDRGAGADPAGRPA